MKAKEYLPPYFEGFERRIFEADTLEGLKEAPFCKNWSVSAEARLVWDGIYLIAKMPSGKSYVVAILEDPPK